MKKIILLFTVVAFTLTAQSQSLNVGDKLPQLVFEDCILPGAPAMIVKDIRVENFTNKVMILDFWATWCGPCIASMKKYEALQTKFRNELEVIGITHESVKRIQAFVKNRPVGFMLAIDTASKWRKYFEYQSIPHVVVVDKQGVVRAITHSDEVTEEVISKIVNNQSVSLTLKKDRMDFDANNDYFNAPADTRESFNLQPALAGFNFSMSKIGQKQFTGRRISMLNFTADAIYRMAYRFSYYRTEYRVDKKEFDHKNRSNVYCLDVIVPEAGDGLYTYMQKKLPQHFDLKARIEKKKMMVTILKRNNEPLDIKKSDTVNKFYGSSSNYFSGNGVKVSALAEFLEDHGMTGTPVIDETGITGHYDIHMEWQPEKKGDWQEEFRKKGFDVVKEEREIDVLVLYR